MPFAKKNKTAKLAALIIILSLALVIVYIARPDYPFEQLQRKDIDHAAVYWYRDEYILTEEELVSLISRLNVLKIFNKTDREPGTGNDTSLTIHYSDGTKCSIRCDGRFVFIDSAAYRADELSVMHIQSLIGECVEKLFENKYEQ